MKQKKMTLQKNPTFTLQQRATENIIKDNSQLLNKVGELRSSLRRLENELLTKKTAISDVQDTSKELRIKLDAAKRKMALQTDELKEFITIINEFMLLDSYQSQLPAKGFPVIRDIRSTGMYLHVTKQGPVKGLFCFKRTASEQALNQLL